MKKLITQRLTGVWESWVVEVDDDVTDEEILSGTAQVNFLKLRDSGWDSCSVEEVEDFD